MSVADPGHGFRAIALALQKAIESGRLAPGAPMTSELELARQWGVSRDTARRALGVLEDQGQVIVRRGVGRFVATSDGEPPRGTSKADHLVEVLQRAIEAGDIKPGSRLPSAADLATQHGVARGTAAQALRLLEEGGLASTIPSRGRFALDPKGPSAQPQTRVAQTVEDLRARMRSGEFAPGAPLPGELALAQLCGVGRGTIRQALATLEETGWVHRHTGKNRTVAAPLPSHPSPAKSEQT